MGFFPNLKVLMTCTIILVKKQWFHLKAPNIKKNVLNIDYLDDDVDSHDGELVGLRQFELFEVGHRVPLEQGLSHKGLVEVSEKLEKQLNSIVGKKLDKSVNS
jgi:hypothetical protein